MSLKNKTVIEITGVTPGNGSYCYEDLILPASEAQIEDAKQRARVFPGNDWMDLSIASCPQHELEGMRLDSPTIEELNFLSQKLQSLNQNEQAALAGLLTYKREHDINGDDMIMSMKELINLTYELDSVVVVPNISTDEALGEFVIENDLEEFLEKLSDSEKQHLDKAEVGKTHRESENGVYANGKYIATGTYSHPEIYDGITLPKETEPAYGSGVFRILAGAAPNSDVEAERNAKEAKWIALPIDKSEADKIANALHEERIEDCVYYGFVSGIPSIDGEVFVDMAQFELLNEIASRYEKMSDLDKVKYKAILQREAPDTPDDALVLSDEQNEYEHNYECCTEEEFAAAYLRKHLPSNFDSAYIETLGLEQFAQKLMDNLDFKVTAYGILSPKGGHLYDIVPYDNQQEIESQQEGGNNDLGDMQI